MLYDSKRWMSEYIATKVAYGLFCCLSCRREWADELPPLWSGLDMMPTCPECASDSELRCPLVPL